MPDERTNTDSSRRDPVTEAWVVASVIGYIRARRLAHRTPFERTAAVDQLSDLNLGDKQAVYNPDDGDVFFSKKYGYEPTGECLIAENRHLKDLSKTL